MKAAPKDPRKNSEYRRLLIEKCVADPVFREQVWIRCSRDFVYWVDTFLFTYDPKSHPSCPSRPFILYPYQEQAAERILKALGVEDILAEKTRQMGFTWLVIAIFVWRWLFRRGQSFLVGSRKESLVDKTGDPTAIFWKADYILEKLPAWMRPSYERTNQHFYNLDNGSTIDGESTNDNFARGGTRTAIALDEFPAVDNGHEILRATRDATHCRLMIGTPCGASGAYYDTREKLLATSPDSVLRMHWVLHPDYSKGLYQLTDDVTRFEILDHDYQFPDGFNFVDVSFPEFKTRSIWFNLQCARAASAQEIAQEIEIDYAKSGWQFFSADVLSRLKKSNSMKPLFTGELILKPDWKTPEWCEQTNGGRIKLWFDPGVDGKVPADWNDISCGVDVATGKGGDMSSQSVASFARRTTGEMIARFATNQMFPGDFCLYVLGLCKWFNNAFLVVEANGPGGEFVKQLVDVGYRNVFYRNDDETKFVSRKTRSVGWWSSKDSKRILLADYFKALRDGSFVNRDEEAYVEAGQYVHEPNGDIVHARSKSTIDPTAALANHGDIVISNALCCRGMAEILQKEKESGPAEPPPNSFGGRRLAWERRQRQQPDYLGDWSVRR